MSNQSGKSVLLISAGLIFAGVLIALIGGITNGSIIGGLITAAGVIPAMYAAWIGTQQETQASLAGAVVMMLLSLGGGGVLIGLGIVRLFF